MTPAALRQRSSRPSSYATGLIGWNGFLVLVALALGYPIPATTIFLVGTLAAIAQVTLLRAAFVALGLDRSLLSGGLWGGLSGVALILAALGPFPALRAHPIVWVLDGAYIGLAVGLFLAYFHRDDRAIEAELGAAGVAGQPVDYGRDAHWLEPFAFGAAAYLVVFLPRSPDLALAALVVGALGGVVAAGVSHFFLFAEWRASALPLLAGVAAGLLQGAASGFLFRQWDGQLPVAPPLLGALAGAATYLLTTLRGRALARCEGVEGRGSRVEGQGAESAE